MYNEFDGESWLTKISVKFSRNLKKATPLQKIGIVITSILSIVFLYNWLRNVFEGSISEEQIKSSSFYGLHEDHVDAYNWLDGVRDEKISNHVINTRVYFNRTKSLILVSNHTKDRETNIIPCDDFVTSTTAVDILTHSAIIFLMKNSNQVCLSVASVGGDMRLLFMKKNDRFETLINPVDVKKEDYDKLNVSELGECTLSKENQTMRYNDEKRSRTYTLFRRAKMDLEFFGIDCLKRTASIYGDMALCIQKEMDLLDGISVFDRAYMQYEKGVQLNKKIIEFYKNQPKQKEVGLKDEL